MMTRTHAGMAVLPTQEQVDEIVRRLAPDVVRIRMRIGEDWAGDPAITFRVILSDDVIEAGRRSEVADTVRRTVSDKFGLVDLDYFSYFKFRAESEQAVLREKSWE